MTKNDGGSAFPVPVDVNPDGHTSGMSLRDYFAAKAMQALISGSPKECGWLPNAERTAYLIADAMLKARDNG